MSKMMVVALLYGMLLILVLALGPSAQAAPTLAAGDEHWSTSWYQNGTDATVNAIGVSGNKLCILGMFSVAGDVMANQIVEWDAAAAIGTGDWSTFGSGIDTIGYNPGRTCAFDHQGNLYVGGEFTSIGGMSANNIAKWNVTTGKWEALGKGSNGPVPALVIDSRDRVFASGYFTAADGTTFQGLGIWDGQKWSPFGQFLYGFPAVLAIDAFDNVYLAGSFMIAQYPSPQDVAKWNAAAGTWQQLPTGLGGNVVALTADNHGVLYAAVGWGHPNFSNPYVARLDTGASYGWSSIGVADAWIGALTLDSSGNLYAGGLFRGIGVVSAQGVAKWNGSAWQALGNGIHGAWGVNALAVAGDGKLYAGGQFNVAGDKMVHNIAKLDNSTGTWSGLGKDTGLQGGITALAVDRAGNVYAAEADPSGGNPVYVVTRWTGNGWQTLGSPMNNWVSSLALDAAGRLYAGGTFTMTGNVPVNRIAKYDAASNGWLPLGSGIDQGSIDQGAIYAMAFDKNGNVYAGGYFGAAGAVAANNIAMWNGTQWSALGSGMNGAVGALAVDDASNLYAGGTFTTTGSIVVNRIAKWDTASGTWSALGSGITVCGVFKCSIPQVNAIATSGSAVYVSESLRRQTP